MCRWKACRSFYPSFPWLASSDATSFALLALPLGYTLLVVMNWCRGGEAKSTVVLCSLLVGGLRRARIPYVSLR